MCTACTTKIISLRRIHGYEKKSHPGEITSKNSRRVDTRARSIGRKERDASKKNKYDNADIFMKSRAASLGLALTINAPPFSVPSPSPRSNCSIFFFLLVCAPLRFPSASCTPPRRSAERDSKANNQREAYRINVT